MDTIKYKGKEYPAVLINSCDVDGFDTGMSYVVDYALWKAMELFKNYK